MDSSFMHALFRLTYKALPFFLIVFLIYKGSDWGKEAFASTKNTILTEICEHEMGLIDRQIRFDLEFKPKNLRDYGVFIKKSFPYEPEKYMKDSWDKDYRFEFNQSSGIYYLESGGPDMTMDTDDDIVFTNDESYMKPEKSETEEFEDSSEEEYDQYEEDEDGPFSPSPFTKPQ